MRENGVDDLNTAQKVLSKRKGRVTIGVADIFLNRESFFALLVCFIGTFDVEFNVGFVAVELKDMGFSEG